MALGADPSLNVDNIRVFTDTSFGLQIRLLFCLSSIYGRKHLLVNADLSRVYVPVEQDLDLYCRATARKRSIPQLFHAEDRVLMIQNIEDKWKGLGYGVADSFRRLTVNPLSDNFARATQS
jgi:hypothetical protein